MINKIRNHNRETKRTNCRNRIDISLKFLAI